MANHRVGASQIMKEGEIRDLLAHASGSFDTVQMEWSAEHDGVLLQRAIERSIPDFQERIKAGSIAVLKSRSSKVEADDGDSRSRNDCRVWWRKPSNWREDALLDGGVMGITIVRGAISSIYVSPLRTMYTTERPRGLLEKLDAALTGTPMQLPSLEDQLQQTGLLDPSFLAGGWELAVLDEGSHIGRDTVRVRATPPSPTPTHGNGGGRLERTTECEVLVDRERGVLLRYAAIVDGAEAKALSVRSVRFDEPIPDEVFAFQPPKGTKIVWCAA